MKSLFSSSNLSSGLYSFGSVLFCVTAVVSSVSQKHPLHSSSVLTSGLFIGSALLYTLGSFAPFCSCQENKRENEQTSLIGEHQQPDRVMQLFIPSLTFFIGTLSLSVQAALEWRNLSENGELKSYLLALICFTVGSVSGLVLYSNKRQRLFRTVQAFSYIVGSALFLTSSVVARGYNITNWHHIVTTLTGVCYTSGSAITAGLETKSLFSSKEGEHKVLVTFPA